MLTCLLRRLGFTVSVAVLCVSAAIASPGITKEPFLRVETGAHLALIARISADAAGRWLVTGSEDKTARLWDADTGHAIAVLRPPIGADGIGAVHAVAISPDGLTVAAGGNSAFEGEGSHLLHLFDRVSASVPPKSTLTGLEAPVTQLAWSRDNQLLAIGLRQEGLRLFRRDLQFVGADPEFNEAIFGAEFAADGRLAVASVDGSIRIYEIGRDGLQRIARQHMPGGKPYGLAFSPDGRTLAVGYQDHARVDLLDSDTLRLAHSIELRGGNLGRVAWSSDGSTLFAAGSHVSGSRFPVLAFAQKGRGPQREIGHFANTVMALSSLPGGRVAAASADPGWAVFDLQGRTLISSRAQSADFRDVGDSFRVDATAETVAFRFSAKSEGMIFSLATGSLNTGKSPATMFAPHLHGDVSDWKNSSSPRFNGRVLPMKTGEVARSLALVPGERSFVLGSEWFVRHFNRDGSLLWEHRVPAAAWAVNVSGDGRWVVAGLGDGSIRWLRLKDGAEQLAFFAHSDRERWIVWTPSGYYDTSVGGENLVGWHLNREFNQSADFFSAGRFRDRLYRPDVIQKVLSAGDEREAFRLAQADLAALEAAGAELVAPPAQGVAASPARPASSLAGQIKSPTPASVAPKGRSETITESLPPVLEFNEMTRTSANSVILRFRARSSADAPVTEYKTRLNNRLVPDAQRRNLRALGMQEIEVPVRQNDSEITILAKNRHGQSEPLKIRLPSNDASGKASSIAKYENLYLLIIGIAKYPSGANLEFADKDARDFNHYMARQSGRLYGNVVNKVLINEQATRGEILKGLKWLRDSVRENDVGVVFFAGHGETTRNTYYFIPADPQALPAGVVAKEGKEFEAWKIKNSESLWVSGEEINKTLLGLKGRAVLFIDTCYSGLVTSQILRRGPNMTGSLNKLGQEDSVLIYASSSARERSQESTKWQNGAFTKAIIDIIRSGDDSEKMGLIRPSYLNLQIKKKVRDMTNETQNVSSLTPGVDEPIAARTK